MSSGYHQCNGIGCQKKIQGQLWKKLCKKCYARVASDPETWLYGKLRSPNKIVKSQPKFKAEMKFRNPRSTWRYTQ